MNNLSGAPDLRAPSVPTRPRAPMPYWAQRELCEIARHTAFLVDIRTRWYSDPARTRRAQRAAMLGGPQ